MPVKKMGSKLAQGVRQIKAQQVTVPVVAEETRVPSTVVPAPLAPSDAKPAPPVPSAANDAKSTAAQGALKPAAVKVGSPGMLHPSRVWPD